MNVLIACEESQTITIEMRKLGHQAFSCDLQEPSGGHPEWHVQGDVLDILRSPAAFPTMDGTKYEGITWDLIIAHPPCTYLSVAANRMHSKKSRTVSQINDRTVARLEAMKFFLSFANANCPKICIENPVGIMNTAYRQPDQIIHPYYFGEPALKRTCLWLYGLPPLDYAATIIERPQPIRVWGNGKNGYFTEACVGRDRSRVRSKTFPGIARAMARQWAGEVDVSKTWEVI